MKNKFFILFIFICFICKSQNSVVDINKELIIFYDAGIPTLNKDWTPEEFTNSMKILMNSTENNYLQLPSKQNNTIEILEKISNYNNYWFFQSSAITNQAKFMYSIDLLNNIGPLYIKYITKSSILNGIHNYSYEICLLNKLIVLMTNEMFVLTDQFLLENPNLTDIQKEGLQKMNKGINTIISGNLITINDEYKYYNENDICSVSTTFFEFYKNNRRRIDDISKREFDDKIKEIQQKHPLACVKKLALLK